MKYRRLGNTDIRISEIGFGAWTIALDWWGKKIDKAEAIRMIKKAYDCGINFFETADMYGKGKSERLLGEALEGVRDDVVISTKYGYDYFNAEQIGHAELPQKFDVDFTRKALESSLERLRTDHIEMYGLHNPKMNHLKNDEPFKYLNELIQDDTVRTLQVALGPAIGWLDEGLLAMSDKNVGAVQTVYNILEQTPGSDLLLEAEKTNTSILVRVPDASGILTGKITADTKIPKNDHRRDRKLQWRMEALKKVEQLRPIADKNGWNITELAIKFILSQGAVGSVLPTVVDVSEIEMFAEISDGKYLPDDDLAEIYRIYSDWPSYKLKSSVA